MPSKNRGHLWLKVAELLGISLDHGHDGHDGHDAMPLSPAPPVPTVPTRQSLRLKELPSLVCPKTKLGGWPSPKGRQTMPGDHQIVSMNFLWQRWSESRWHSFVNSNYQNLEFSNKVVYPRNHWLIVVLMNHRCSSCLRVVIQTIPIWRFSWVIGVPLVIIHFERWDFPQQKPSSYWGTPMTMETHKPLLSIISHY